MWLKITTSLLGLNDLLMWFAALIGPINVLLSADYERDCNQLIYRNTHAHVSCDNDAFDHFYPFTNLRCNAYLYAFKTY